MADIIKTVADYQADIAGAGTPYNGADNVILQDSTANLANLTTSDISNLAANGVDSILSTDNVIDWDLAQWQALGGSFDFNGALLALYDTGANLSAIDPADLASLAANEFVQIVDASDDAVTFTTAQLLALRDNGIALTDADVVTVSDPSLPNEEYYAMGVDIIGAPPTFKTVAEYQADNAGGTPYADADQIIIEDSAANLATLTTTEIGNLFLNKVDSILSDDNLVQWNADQWQALGSPFDFNGANLVLYDTGANLAALSTLSFAAIAGVGVGTVDASDDAVSFTNGQLSAIRNNGMTLTASDTVTLSDVASNIDVTSAGIVGYGGQGVDIIDATDDGPFTIDAEAAGALAASTVAFAASDAVTLSDFGVLISGLGGGIAQLGAKGVDVIDALDDALTLTVDQFSNLGTVSLTAGDNVVVADTGANLATMDFATLAAGLVDSIDATDNVLSLNVAQYNNLGGVALTAADVNTLADTGGNIAALSAGALSALSGNRIDKVDATDDFLRLSIAQLNALGTVTLTAGDTNVMADAEANIEGLSGLAFWSIYGSQGVDVIDANEDILNLSADQVAGVNTAGSMTFATGDLVTLVDSSANVLATFGSDLGELGALNLDRIDLTDNAIELSLAQLQALAPVVFAASDTGVVAADTEANLEALSAAALTLLGSQGVDRLDSSDGAVSFTAAQYTAMGSIVFTGADTVTVSGTAAQLAALDFSTLAAHNVDRIDATDDVLNLTVAQYNALGGVQLTADDVVTILDTGANIAGISAATMSGLAASNVDKIDATDDAVSLSAAQLDALGSVALTAADTVTLLDTRANIEALSLGALSGYGSQGVDVIDSTSDVLHMNATQVGVVVAASGMSFAAGDTVVMVDSGANVKSALTGAYAQAAADHLDSIDLTDNAIGLSVSEFQALGSVGFAADDTDVAALDAQSNLEALDSTTLAALLAQGVDRLDASDTDAVTFTAAQYTAMGAMTFTTGDTVVVTGTGAELAALTGLSAHHVDRIDATDDVLTLSLAQLSALSSTQLTAGDTVTMLDTSANIEALTFGNFTAYGAAGVDVIDASDDQLELSASQVNGVATIAGVTFAAGDTVTLVDSSANVLGLFGSNLGALPALGVDLIDLTDDAVTLSLDQLGALGAINFAASDVVTASDTEADLEALSASDLTALAAQGVGVLDASDTDALTFNAARYMAMGSSIVFAAGDTVVVTGAGATLAGLSGFSAHNVDRIDASDDVLSLSIAQLSALGSTQLTAADTVTLLDTSSAIEALTFGQFTTFGAAGVDVIDASDDHLELTAAQVNGVAAIAGMHFKATDTVTLSDTGANVLAAFGGDFGRLGDINVDGIDLTDGAINIGYNQLLDLGAVHFAADDTGVVLLDTGSLLGELGGSSLQSVVDAGVDRLDASDNAATFSLDQLGDILGAGLVLTAGDVITIVDTGADFAALTPGEIDALAANGVDQIDLADNAIELTGAQYAAFADNFTFRTGDLVRVNFGGADDVFTGGVERDIFLGKHGDDVLNGGDGADSLKGGGGADLLTGGAGNDFFIFSTVGQSKAGAMDRITDLDDLDKIDLHMIDADVNTAGDQAFTQIVSKFTHHAGEILVKYHATADVTVFKLDVDGDGKADAQFLADGDHRDFTNFLF